MRILCLFSAAFIFCVLLKHSHQETSQQEHPVMKAFGLFMREIHQAYFADCSLIVLDNSQSDEYPSGILPNHDKKSNRTTKKPMIDDIFYYVEVIPKLILSLKGKLSETLDTLDLNIVSRCPVYISVTTDIDEIKNFFLLSNKDWDKYFLSRKHIIFTMSAMRDIEDFLDAGELHTMTNVLFVRPSQEPQYLQLLTNNPYPEKFDGYVQTLMIWKGGSMESSKYRLFVDKLTNFNGREMDVVTFHFPPRIFMIEKDDGSYQLYGVDIDVVNSLSDALNFTVLYRRPSDNEMWGWEQDNGSWTGLMGDLQHRMADIGVADLYIMEHYFAIIDMSIEYDFEYLCFVNPVPGPLPQWMALGLPFLMEAWIAILITIVVGMVLFVFVAQVGNFSLPSAEATWFCNATNTCLLLFGCVMNTAWIRVPKSSHLRIFVVLWSFAFIILAVAFKGSLVSYLTFPLDQPPIDTHKQLNAKDIDVGSIGFTLKRVMEKNADEHVRKLAKRYQHVPSTKVGLERTLKGKFSFLESRGFLDYTIAVDHTDHQGRASLHAMREYIAPFGIGLAYPKYVPYIGKFNRVIRQLTEAGFAKKWMADIILRSKQAKINNQERKAVENSEDGGGIETNSNSFKPLNLDNLQGGFVLLAIGYGLGLLIFAFEFIETQLRGDFWK